MKNMTRAQRRRQAKIRKMLLSLSLVLVICMAAVGGTIAWLTSVTGEVTNTFTYGDIEIKLDETTGSDYKFIPSVDLAKDPKVTFTKDSEACYLFVKVTESGWNNKSLLNGKITYAIDSAWTELTGVALGNGEKVYYRTLTAAQAKTGQKYYILAGDVTNPNGFVDVSENVTKQDLETLKDVEVKLTFKAYAIQSENTGSASDAWTKLQASMN